MILPDPAHKRVRVIPVLGFLFAAALVVVLVLELTGAFDFQRLFGNKPAVRRLVMAALAGIGVVGSLWHFRTISVKGNAVVVRSVLKTFRFMIERLHVFVERREVYHHRGFRRKRIIWEVGLEDRVGRVVLHTCQSSPTATAVAAKIRNALGIGMYDSWTRTNRPGEG